jgi:hypothetical protein
MTETLGFIVVAKVPAPQSVHGWLYEPICDRHGTPAVIPFELGGARNILDYCHDRATQGQPVHGRADSYLIARLVAVDAAKPAWPQYEPVRRAVDLDAVWERLPIGHNA